jgi:RNA polymerase sigma-70 factor (ECF subfamily)
MEAESGELTDEVLYHRVRQGDLSAFDLLYGRYERRLFGFICKLVHNHHDAEDLFHESFVSVLRSKEVTFDRGSFCAWLYRIARNQSYNHLRSGRRASQLQQQVAAPSPPPSAEVTFADGERAAFLEQAVATLPPLLAEIYHLRSAGLSYEEMAEVLRIPLGTVKSRMNQMTQRLRDDVARRAGGREEPPSDVPARETRGGGRLQPAPPDGGGREEPPFDDSKEYKAHGLRSN